MLFWLLATGIFATDQLTKWLVRTRMELGESIPIIDRIFHLSYVENRGAAFGILANQTTFFIVITIAVLMVIAYFYRRIPPHNNLLKVGLALQAGGAVGNLTDRLVFGFVIDFFDLRVWPVFNIADMAIVGGVGFLLWEIVKNDKLFDPPLVKEPNAETTEDGEKYDSR